MLHSVWFIYKIPRGSTGGLHFSLGKLWWMFGGECKPGLGIIQGPALHGDSRYECHTLPPSIWGMVQFSNTIW